MRTQLFVLILLLIQGVSAFAQNQDYTNLNVTSKAGIGTTDLPTSSSLKLGGLTTSGGDQVLIINSSSLEVIRRVLAKADLPSAIAYEDETNTFTPQQFFNSNIRVGNNTGDAIIRVNSASSGHKGLWFQVDGSDVGSINVWNSNSYFDLPGTFSFRSAGGTLLASLTQGGLITSLGGVVTRDTLTTIPTTSLGFDNARFGVQGGAPRIILEDISYPLNWQIVNANGELVIWRSDATGIGPFFDLQMGSNWVYSPPGKRIIPREPYGVDLGSQQYKFGAIWVGDAFFDRIVTIENIGTVDNRWLIGNGNMLDEDLAPAGTSMVTRYNNYTVNTFVYFQKFARTEFIKITAGPTLTNLSTNSSFEGNSTTGWSANPGTSISTTNAKSYHGEYSMLVDFTSGSFLHAGTLTVGAAYTTCVYARRVDGAAMVDNDVLIYHANTFVGAPAQKTETDGWYRFCRASVAGNAGGGSQQTHFSIASSVAAVTDVYFDAVQTENTFTSRPYSAYRASYTIARNQEASAGGANQWYAGDGMFGVGANTGDGWLDCYAIRGIKSATEQGPACVVNVRNGSSFNSWTQHAAWGNLSGIYGYGSTTWGFAAGQSGDDYFTIEATNGYRIFAGGVQRFHIDTAGTVNIGIPSTGNAQLHLTAGSIQLCSFGIACSVFIDGSNGNISMRGDLSVGTTGAGGVIRSVATGYDTGTGYWMDYNSGAPRFRIGTTTSGSNYFRFTGTELEYVSNRLRISPNGISVKAHSAPSIDSSFAFRSLNSDSIYQGGMRALTGTAGGFTAYTTVVEAGEDIAPFTSSYSTGGIVLQSHSCYLVGGCNASNNVTSSIGMLVGPFDTARAWIDLQGTGSPGSAQLYVTLNNASFNTSITPGTDDLWSLGGPSNRWRDIYWDETGNTVTGAMYPIVSDSGRFRVKTNGFTGACSGAPTVVQFGLIISC